ncbi:hypothetical protein RRG08_039894 [Elysia crispata]|uniref:DUF885 domain-containing protein n=1 Tax=Elysia crispata TaxID=231223 RepID=A0AAE1DNV4_9GAST|nr:hypothetical protein RRG08_039894 [Elysia crispata]
MSTKPFKIAVALRRFISGRHSKPLGVGTNPDNLLQLARTTYRQKELYAVSAGHGNHHSRWELVELLPGYGQDPMHVMEQNDGKELHPGLICSIFGVAMSCFRTLLARRLVRVAEPGPGALFLRTTERLIKLKTAPVFLESGQNLAAPSAIMKTLQCLLLVAIHVAIAQGDEHIQLKYLEREFYSWRKAERGIGDYRQDDRLEQFDLELIDIRTEYAGYLLETLLNISKVNLSEKDQMDYAIMQDMLQAYTNGRNWSRWTYLTPMSWLEGLQRNPDLFVESTNFLNIGDFENYISKLHDFPRLFREYKISFNEAIRLGRASNIRSIDRIPGQIEHILNVSVTQSIYYKPFITYLNDTYLSLPDPEAVIESVQKRGLKAVEIVFEAYKDLKDYLENIYMKNTRPSAGLGTLAGGADFYQECLNWYLSLKMTPGEIHRLGLQEIDKIKDKMYEIIEKQGYHNISIRDYFAELKKREDMFFDTEDDIIAEYENIIHRRIEPHLNKFFRDQPGLPVVVHPMPSDGSRGWYYSGSADGMRPGIFYANTKRRVPKYVMMSLAMHESNPGHHLQMSYSLTSDLSDFRKNSENNEKFRVPFAIPSYTAFVEGWALYAESLGVETGIYEKDYELLGYYESELFRAARLAVDTGLHYFNWTRDQAQEFFIQHTAESKEGIVVEVDRYITWPGQATTYKIGELWIRALRERAEKELGELFDVREFHMAVLENGAIPLPILEDQVLKWIKDYRKRKLEEEEMDGECECVMVPRAKPKVRCRRSSPLTLEPNAAHRLQAVYIIPVALPSSGPEAILFCQKLAVTNGNECPASLKPSAFTSKAKCLHLKLDWWVVTIRPGQDPCVHCRMSDRCF